MEKGEIKKLIREILTNNDHGIKMPGDFDNNDSLFLKGIIDSFGIFPFVNELQMIFNLEIENKDVHPRNLETIENVTTFIYNKKREAE